MGGSTFGGRWHRPRITPYRLGVLVLLLACFALRVYSVSRWTWADDDWVYMERARSMSFWAYLFQNYNGHLMPGEFLISRVVAWVAPLRYGVVIVLVASACALSLGGWAMALRELFGERLRLLLPLGLLGFSPLAVRPSVWWASALQMIPLQLFTGCCVLLAARYVRRHDRTSVVAMLTTFVAALLFWEKAVLIWVPVLGVLLFCSPDGVLRTLRRAWPLLLSLGVATAAYLVAYLRLTALAPGESQKGLTLHNGTTLGGAIHFYAKAAKDSLVPAALGGPWGSSPTEADKLAEPSMWVVVLSTVMFVTCAIALAYFRRRSWLPLLMVAGYAVTATSLILFSDRVAFFGDLAIRDERYTIDSLAVGTLAMAMLISPGRGEHDAWRREPAAWMGSRITWVSAAAVLGVSLVVGNVLVIERNGIYPGAGWVQNITADIDRLGPVAVVDGRPPDRVLSAGFFADAAQLSKMLSPLGSKVSFDGPAQTLYVAGSDGHLRPAAIQDVTHALPGPLKGCGYPVRPGATTRVPMNHPLYELGWGVQVTAYTGQPSTLLVQIDHEHLRVPIGRGFERHQAAFTGPVHDVRLSLAPGSGPVCVTEVVIGPVHATRSGS